MRNPLSISLPVLVLFASIGAGAPPMTTLPRAAGRLSSGAPNWELPLPESGPRRVDAPDERISVYVVLEGRGALESIPRSVHGDSPEAQEAVRQEVSRLRGWHKTVAQQVRDLGGQVEADLVRLTNALQVNIARRNAGRLAGLPGVIRVEQVPRYRRALKSAVPFVAAPALWGNPGVAITGKGVRVGIVDTGIDYLHADFGGPGTPEAYQANDRTVVEPGTFPTTKVVGGKDFVGDDYTGENSVVPDEDPLDCARMQSQYISGGHGTHVAGITAGMGVWSDGSTFAGPYEASFDPSAFRVAPGVAPEASLYALKIFGCDGSTTMVAAALEWAVDPNDDGDTSDRLDVINMSLGGSYGLATATDETIVRNITDAGTLLVVAAGNDGDAFYATGEPSTYTQVMSVAATTDVVSFLALRIDAPSSIAGEVPCAEGAFTRPLAESGPISGQLTAAKPASACGALTNKAEVQGRIAFVDRGGCYFVEKLKNAFDAGATAVVVANNAAGEPPFAMGGDGGTTSGIPGVMIAMTDAALIRTKLAQGVSVTLDGSNLFQSSADADQMAEFSSRGPRASDNRLKPDLTAPGVAIDSAGVASGTSPREMSGTSMACPMVAGGAALVRQANPSFGPLEVKAAMMNSAATVKDSAGNPIPASLAGAGRMRVDRAAFPLILAAVDESAAPGAVSVSFRSIVTAEPATGARSILVENQGDEPLTLEARVVPSFIPEGAAVQLDATTVQLPAKGTASVAVTLSVDPEALPVEAPDPSTPSSMSLGGGQSYARHFLTEASGVVTFKEVDAPDDTAVRVPFHGVVRAASQLEAQIPARCEGDATDEVQIPLGGPSVHKEPLTTAYQLMATSPVKPVLNADDAAADLIAIGVATNVATAEDFESASVYFGVAVAGQWTTPAKGPLSLVAVAIDTTGDNSPDYAVFAEPLTREGPYADVLTATTYDLATGGAVDRRFLNLVPRDVYNTEPFNNSVVLLPVGLDKIGLTQGAAALQFYAFTQGLTFPQTKDSTAWLSYDPTNAPVDTAQGGKDGIPFYPGLGPVRVRMNPSAIGDGPAPSILLLHHSNVADQRAEIVDLSDIPTVAQGDLRIAMTAPERMKEGSTANVTLTITNVASEAASEVRVQASVAGGGTVTAVASPQGTCTTGAAIDCELGELAAGESLDVTIELAAGAEDVHILAAVGTKPDCDSSPADNHASITVLAGDAPPVTGAGGTGGGLRDRDIGVYETGGGCACAVQDSRGAGGWGTAALLGAAALWRQRRRSVKPGN